MISQSRAMQGKPVRARPARGKPVRALFVILGGWVLMRAALWPSSLVMQVVPPQILGPTAAFGARASAAVAVYVAGRTPDSGPAVRIELPPLRPALDPPIRAARLSYQPLEIGDPHFAGLAAPMPERRIVGHILLLAAGLANMELDPALSPFAQDAGFRAAHLADRADFVLAPASAQEPRREAGNSRRWSMDAWALWRENDNSPLLSGRPSYGRSQAGAVARFALTPSSSHAPQAFLRASAALAGAREREQEQEGAVGISARPLPLVPVRMAGEARLRSAAGDTDTRFAAFAVTEIPPLALPGGATGEVYVQGGYVTGRDATGFIDGQVRITRDLVVGERFRLSAGGGAWGGAQEGSGRLDIGPSASLSINAGGVFARLSADYRFRMRGAAEPASGPALTISAGF